MTNTTTYNTTEKQIEIAQLAQESISMAEFALIFTFMALAWSLLICALIVVTFR